MILTTFAKKIKSVFFKEKVVITNSSNKTTEVSKPKQTMVQNINLDRLLGVIKSNLKEKELTFNSVSYEDGYVVVSYDNGTKETRTKLDINEDTSFTTEYVIDTANSCSIRIIKNIKQNEKRRR